MEQRFENIERRFGRLPPDVKAFYERVDELSKSLPGRICEGEISTVVDQWIGDEAVEKVCSNLQGNFDRQLLPIGRCYSGDYLVVDLARCSVFLWLHEEDSLRIVSDGIAELLEKIEPVAATADAVERAFREDDLSSFEKLLENGTVTLNMIDGQGRGLFENAAIFSAQKISEFLFSAGVDAHAALKRAEANLPFFPETKGYVEFLRAKMNEGTSE